MVFGPGDDDYGRNPNPPAPIPQPDSDQTKIVCEHCLQEFPLAIIEQLQVVSDSEQEYYDSFTRLRGREGD